MIDDGFLVIVKRDCPTCVEIAPALRELVGSEVPVTIASQDDRDFPEGVPVLDDSDLEVSWRLGVEVTPTAIRIEAGSPTGRIVGWRRSEWEAFFGVDHLAPDLPEFRPGCGSRTLEPGMEELLAERFDGATVLRSRRVELGSQEDEAEALHARGWTDGLPVVAPTEERVRRMLTGTERDPDDVVAIVAPDYQPCTVEKAAVNAVMAGCLPSHLPVVLAAVRAIAAEPFDLHGVAATTWYSGPVLIVNGPVADRIGMNSGINAFGPGNRPNATIGRAVNLVVRNIGGSRPGEVDRSTQGHPTKYTMAFAEREHDSPWESLGEERGIASGVSCVTAFAGQGPAPFADQVSRTPESLARSFAAALRVVRSPKSVGRVAAIVAVSPEHAAVFGSSGWTKQRLRRRLIELLTIPDAELVRGAGGIEDGMAGEATGSMVPKFTEDNLWFVHVGGTAGGTSGVISGWVGGPKGSQMVTVPVEEA